MTKDELRSVVEDYVRDSQTGRNSEISASQARAMDLYLGNPLGNEVEGRSSVVSRDVADTIEWIIPSLLRVFLQDDVVVFDPVCADDEDQAALETKYTNHVIMKQNPGFMLFLTWFKDALLKKVGYVKYYWEKVEEPTFETYTGLSPEEANYVLQNATQYGTPEVVEAEEEEGLISFKLKYLRKKGQVKILNVPVDEVSVSKDCGFDLQDAACVAHERLLTRSELVAMGYAKDEVEELSSFDNTSTDTIDRVDGRFVEISGDPSMETIRLLEAYVKVDFDKDGIAERRRVLIAGNKVLENEEYDRVPFSYLTPIPLPHQHVGLGYTDLVEDLMLIKTALIRGLLDNTYLTNNNRWAVNENNVYMEDFLTSRPGGVVRTMGNPGQDIVPIQSESIINKVLPAIAFVDETREVRTGVGKMTSGLDGDVLQNSTKGAYDVATNAASQRIEAVARIFAETGVSDLIRGVHELLIKNQDFDTKMRLSNEEWTNISPLEWRYRTETTVKVGLGNNNDEQRKASLAMLMQVMEKSAAFGLVLPNNAYNFAEQAAKELGFQKRGVYFTDPKSPEFQQAMQARQEQKNPLVEIEEIKAQVRMMAEQMKQQHLQGKTQLEAAEMQTDKMEKDRRFALDVTDTELKYKTDLLKTGIGAELERYRGSTQG